MSTTTYIGINGKATAESESFIKVVTIGEAEHYFALVYNGTLVNPYQDRFTLSKRQLSKFRTINSFTYKNYLKFLQSTETLYLNAAKRGLAQ
jgi:hypothetical protein